MLPGVPLNLFTHETDGEIALNPEEASAIRWVSFGDLKEELRRTPEKFSSWFIICAPRVMHMIEDGSAVISG